MSAWLPTLLLVLGAALQASAQDPAVEAPVEPAPRVEEPRPETDKDLDRELARKTGTERWEAMSEEQRALLRERFEAFRKLTPEQREALKERARQLEQQRRELREGLEPELREHLDRLPPHERDRILREQQLDERKDRGRRLRGSLPPEHREWLEGLVDGGPPPPLEDMRERIHGRFGGRAIEHMREAGHLTEEQVRRLEGLDGRERMLAFFAIERERLLAHVAEAGLPEGVSAEAWAELASEEDPKRFMKRARRLGLELFGPSPGDRGQRGERGDRGGRRDGRSGGPGGPGKPGGRGPYLPEDAPAWAPALVEAMRPTLADRLALGELSRDEARAAMEGMVAARVRSILTELEGLSAERKAALAGLGDGELVRALDELLEAEVFGGVPRRDGPPGSEGRRPGGRRGFDGPPEGGPGGRGDRRPDGPRGKAAPGDEGGAGEGAPPRAPEGRRGEGPQGRRPRS